MVGMPHALHDEIFELAIVSLVFFSDFSAALVGNNNGFLQIHEIQVGGLQQNVHPLCFFPGATGTVSNCTSRVYHPASLA